jgi:hypothetical protein
MGRVWVVMVLASGVFMALRRDSIGKDRSVVRVVPVYPLHSSCHYGTKAMGNLDHSCINR